MSGKRTLTQNDANKNVSDQIKMVCRQLDLYFEKSRATWFWKFPSAGHVPGLDTGLRKPGLKIVGPGSKMPG